MTEATIGIFQNFAFPVAIVVALFLLGVVTLITLWRFFRPYIKATLDGHLEFVQTSISTMNGVKSAVSEMSEMFQGLVSAQEQAIQTGSAIMGATQKLVESHEQHRETLDARFGDPLDYSTVALTTSMRHAWSALRAVLIAKGCDVPADLDKAIEVLKERLR